MKLIDSPELFTSRPVREQYGAICSRRMLDILSASGEWMTRADLAAHGLSPRLCRLARQHSGGAIIAGQRGYRATSCATLEELHEAATVLRGQADTMMREVMELWRVINRRSNAEHEPRAVASRAPCFCCATAENKENDDGSM